MQSRINHLINHFKKDLALLASISLGVFLFVLFFQPFPLGDFDFNNRLLFVGGLALIIFFIMTLARMVVPVFMTGRDDAGEVTEWPQFLGGLLIWLLSSVAFVFYLRFVGHVFINFVMVFRVVMICSAPPTVLRLRHGFARINKQNLLLETEVRNLRQQLNIYRETNLAATVAFVSETNSDNLELVLSDVVYIRSADNYVEVIYREGNGFKKQLIRNTLKKIEQQLKPYTFFVRCHRTCLVNLQYAENLDRLDGGYWLRVKGLDERLPISRQHLLRIKELL